MSTNTRINSIDLIETALRMLEAYDYDTSSIWNQHREWLKQRDTREITQFDIEWATRAQAPSLVSEHIEGGQFEQLSATNCFADRQYTLSPAQREVLRERYGLTPAQTVIVTDVATFPKSNVIWYFNIKSAEHVDARRRKHVLIEAVIQPASEFFAKAAQIEKEKEAELEAEDKKRVKKGEEPKLAKTKALQYFE